MLNIKLIDVLNAIKTSMNFLSEDFINHGDETAYICYKIGQKLNYDKEYLDKFVVVSMLHDIGACKTDSLKSLLEFDKLETNNHCSYSYLFLKYFSPLEENIAKLTLYHHSHSQSLDITNKNIIPIDSNLISLGDTISMLKLKFKNKKIFLSHIESLFKNKDNYFDSLLIETLIQLNKEENIIENILNNSYKEELYSYYESIDYTEEDIKKYIFLLGSSIYFKSTQTYIHSVAVYSATKKISSLMNLNYVEKEECELAAFLHDIGKIVTPSEILKFPGKLSDNDFKIMKKHVEYSSEILSYLNHDNIHSIASNHHERLNGTGYPSGLSTDLRIQDNILAVSDVLSALSENRYYRDGISKEGILKILNNEVENGHFAKNIVDIVIENYDEILNEINLEKDKFLSLLEKINEEYQEIISKVTLIEKYNN